jgi:large subunit ribosomal protein L36
MNARTPRLSPLQGRDYEQKGALMKVRNSLRSLKDRPGAQIVRRHGKVYVINRKDPRGKARQG